MTKILPRVLCLLSVCFAAQPTRAQTPPPRSRVVIAADVLLDGRGRVLRRTSITSNR